MMKCLVFVLGIGLRNLNISNEIHQDLGIRQTILYWLYFFELKYPQIQESYQAVLDITKTQPVLLSRPEPRGYFQP